MKTNFSVLGFSFCVGGVISGVGLGAFGWGYRALGSNCKREVFRT